MSNDTAPNVFDGPVDVAVWNEWFRVMYPRVYYTLYRRTGGNADLSQECTQAAMERFLRYRGYEKVENNQKAVAYLTRIALNHLTNEHRSTARLEPLEDDVPDPQRSGDERREQLNLVAKRLGSKERDLLKQVYAGYSTAEIASQLGIGYNAAATRIHRLKKRMAEILTDLKEYPLTP